MHNYVIPFISLERQRNLVPKMLYVCVYRRSFLVIIVLRFTYVSILM